MATITIALRHSQGVTLQYVALSTAEKAAITTLAVEAYNDDPPLLSLGKIVHT